ncbi:hypothetical protein [Acinetobacter sp. ANC 3813]|uniref:hypothetical protein n=1 Tax=Acinetobacter sp. ANC 3813 TaxID=1977873 RepID=UPI00111BE975|nr:hypothetical protein [Acinetobacter sp. ANC 3813]
MATGRRTREITFNINDRGRTFTGVARTNVDIQTWIDLINSPQTQEMIATGSMLGYYGHQVRVLFGLDVPETAFVGGKQISISPAVRTIEMKCDQDGNLTHRQEFLDTPEGNQAMRNYKAKIGGFSAANDYKKINNIIYPTISYGMDYVLQQNYVQNTGDGMLDSVAGSIVRQEMETSLLAMYDSIYSTNFAAHIADENLMRAINAENALLEDRAKRAETLRLHAENRNAMLDSALCPTLSFDDYMNQAKEGVKLLDSVKQPDTAEKEVSQPVANPTGWFNFF